MEDIRGVTINSLILKQLEDRGWVDVIGHRETGTGTVKGPGVYVYSCDDEAQHKWSKHVIDDGGVAVEDAFAADLNGDGKPDLVAGGRATHNVKLYINRGVAK